MRLNIELDGSTVQELAFFADTVLWSGGLTGDKVSGRLTLDGMSPDPCGKCPELTTLTVHDECARAVDARVETCADGTRRIVGRLELPVIAGFTDDCGNTYTIEGRADYDIYIAADGLEDDCGELAFSCAASALTVQATSPDCVAYQLTLDVKAYLLRSQLVHLSLTQDDAAGAVNGPVTVQDGGFARICRRPTVRYTAQPTRATSGGVSDALVAGAARRCAAHTEAPAAEPERSAQDETGGVEVIGDDEYRTVVKLPLHRRRR